MPNNAKNHGDGTPLPNRVPTARASTAHQSSVRAITARLSCVRGATGRMSSVRSSTATAGSRRMTARQLLIPTAETNRSRNRSGAAGAAGFGVTPVGGGGARKAIVGAANLGNNSVFRAEGVDAAAVNMPRTTASTTSHMGTDANNRRLAMHRTLEQPQLWQQRPVKPAGETSSIQAERQKRRNRGLNLGYVGMLSVCRLHLGICQQKFTLRLAVNIHNLHRLFVLDF